MYARAALVALILGSGLGQAAATACATYPCSWTRGVLRRTDESYEGAVSPPRRLFVGAAEKRPQTSSAHLMLPGGPCTQSDEDLMTIRSCMSVLATGARGAVASLLRRGGVAPRPGRR